MTRFTFDSPDLLSGIAPILVMVGLFAIGELLAQTGEPGWEKAAERRGADPVSRSGDVEAHRACRS